MDKPPLIKQLETRGSILDVYNWMLVSFLKITNLHQFEQLYSVIPKK